MEFFVLEDGSVVPAEAVAAAFAEISLEEQNAIFETEV